MSKNILTLVLFAVTFALLAACSVFKVEQRYPAVHPEELGQARPICTECHDASAEHIDYAQFNHDTSFVGPHRQQAYQNPEVCAMCHAQSFCNDCHATRVELKPSLKNPTDTYRVMQHRGDYLSRHQMDGRADPTSCFRCHGNPRSAETCARCHG